MALYRNTYTFDEIFNIIKNKINENNDKKLTFWGSSGIGVAILKAISFFISEMQLQANIIALTSRINTAWGRHLELLLEDSNFPKKENTYAQTIQRFYGSNDRLDDVLIPANTVVRTADDYFGNNIKYETITDTVLLLSEDSVTGLIQCTQAGTVGNVLSGAINILEDTIIGISGTSNVEDIGNGSNLEKDIQYKDRYGYYLLGLKKGNESAILDAVYAVDGVVYADLKENFPANGIFTIFVTTENGIVDTVLKAKINNAVKAVKGFTVIPNIISPIVEPVTLELDLRLSTNVYNSEAVKENIRINLKNYVNVKSKSVLYKSDIIQEVRKDINVLDVQDVFINDLDSSLILDELYTIKVLETSDIVIYVL